jgi:hypothetical protein
MISSSMTSKWSLRYSTTSKRFSSLISWSILNKLFNWNSNGQTFCCDHSGLSLSKCWPQPFRRIEDILYSIIVGF